VRALSRVETLAEPARLTAWLYRVLRNEAHDQVARATRERASGLSPDELAEASPDDEPRACCCSLALLPTLRPEQEALLRRVDLAGEPLERVARELGLTKNATTVRLHRARKALRELWSATCGTSGARACGDCACPR
jgi:RNA polymerase sigma-70 factor (ECF subfamily)